jgi:hypothetical protein
MILHYFIIIFDIILFEIEFQIITNFTLQLRINLISIHILIHLDGILSKGQDNNNIYLYFYNLLLMF